MDDFTIAMTLFGRFPERLVYWQQAIAALQANLRTGRSCSWLIAAEGQGLYPGARQDIESIFRSLPGGNNELVWHEEPPDLGANLNQMIAAVRTPAFLYVQDDWELHRPLTIDDDLRLIASNPGIDFVQYYWWPDRDEALGHRLRVDRVSYFKIVPEHQDWYYRDNPYLARTEVFQRLGPFETRSGAHGQHAEFYMARRARDLRVGVYGRGDNPRNYTRYFRHLGAVSAIHGTPVPTAGAI